MCLIWLLCCRQSTKKGGHIHHVFTARISPTFRTINFAELWAAAVAQRLSGENEKNKWYQEDPGSLPTPGNLFKKNFAEQLIVGSHWHLKLCQLFLDLARSRSYDRELQRAVEIFDATGSRANLENKNIFLLRFDKRSNLGTHYRSPLFCYWLLRSKYLIIHNLPTLSLEHLNLSLDLPSPHCASSITDHWSSVHSVDRHSEINYLGTKKVLMRNYCKVPTTLYSKHN
jgi:hypothetical protein